MLRGGICGETAELAHALILPCGKGAHHGYGGFGELHTAYGLAVDGGSQDVGNVGTFGCHERGGELTLLSFEITVVGLLFYHEVNQAHGSLGVGICVMYEIAVDEISTYTRLWMILHKQLCTLLHLWRRSVVYHLAKLVHQFVVFRSLHGHLLKV